MKIFSKIINEKTKELECIACGGKPLEGYSDLPREQAYNGNWYVAGYAPVKPQEVKEQEVRAVREQYFADYVDWYQSKHLLWEEMNEEEKQDIADYRKYLMDYTKQEDWWEKNPLDFEEWKSKKK